MFIKNTKKHLYWKGKKFSEEHKRKIGLASKGRKNNLGKKFSKKWKENLSKSHKEEKNYWFNKHLSKEHKEKISKSEKGKKVSYKSRQKISKSRIGKFRGANSPSWKGGITSEVMRIRNSLEMKLWRKAVFERDNYTCQSCGDNKGGNLNAHHILPFSTFPHLRFTINNGITLCKKCHIKIHKI